MLIGLFLRHYKCYKKLNYISFITPYNQPKLNLIVGNNGSGKSSLLEAIDVYFNKSKFVLSKDEKWQEALVSPVFLIDKSFTDKIWNNHIGKIKKKEVEDITEFISNFLWNLEPAKAATTQNNFKKVRNTFGKQYSQKSHFLLVDGIDYEGNIALATFDQLYNDLVENFTEPVLKQFFYSLRASIVYVYIPVETTIKDYLRLEGNGIQILMGTDVKAKIDSIFQEIITKDKRKISLIGYINETLGEFVNTTQESIQKIEENYSFEPDYGYKQNVTSKDLRGQIITEFFKNRQLKRGKTKIEDLSSGQRKKALVDIIYSLIKINYENNEKELIIAIDEPEASLHINNCYNQFEKLHKIASHNIQTLVTTHWYGAIPIMESGTVMHVQEELDKPPNISIFDSSNVYDNHNAHRIEDINFKSIYDLASSLLSMLRNGNKNWVIVEGKSDKYYLESYLDKDKIRVLSVGGIDRLIDLVDFLSIPLSNRNEKKESKNKIIFISDNDREYKASSSKTSSILYFKRYIFQEGKVKLVDYSVPKHGEVLRIEDVMNADIMWKALNNIAEDIEDLKKILSNFTQEKDFTVSMFKGDYAFFRSDKNGQQKIKLMQILYSTLEPLKTRLALEYKTHVNGENIDWIEQIKNMSKI